MEMQENNPDPVTEAYDEYVAGFRAGHGDPSPYLDRFEGRERRELELLIESFIATGPVSDPDPADPRVDAIFERVLAELDGQSGGLSEYLALLRQKAGKTQSAVVSALSKSVGATPAEAEKIDEYYHQLEWGSLPAGGLSERLYGMLGKILSTEPERLKEAAAAFGPRYGAASGPVFARSDNRVELDEASVAPRIAGFASPDESDESARPDRIDELFTGG